MDNQTRSFENTAIWQRALAARDYDHNERSRERFRNSFLQFRSNVEKLVGLIGKDMPSFTVHDISHLDALWEIASTIAGDDYPLNPAEAFVLGGGILLHDAAMCLAAYPGGMQDLQKTPQWRDSVAELLSSGGKTPTPGEIASPPQEIARQALQETLRLLHAQKARDLGTQKWTMPGDGEEFYLLEDSDLRHHYGPIIGQIAESHWWDVSKLEQLQPKKLTAAARLPSDWTVDPVKVACLLRTADAAHIDQRRAPRFLAVLLKPQGLSAAHWNFQAKMGKPVPQGDALLYSSGQTFSVEEYESWWLTFQSLDMIDRELRQVDILLEQTRRPRFAARRVIGAESPEHAKEYLPTSGWTPVDTRLHISNVARVVEMLGGKQLYGNDAKAALRELIQNAADAVRARRKLEQREDTWGEIEVQLEKQGEDYWLHVSDNGIGMSPRVMTQALMDFGNSFWRSPLVREEFPGLLGSGMHATGRFGIGFFSVFMLGKEVRVLSRRYDRGVNETNVLEFRQGLDAPPFLRFATSEERRFLRDGGTRVSIKLAKDPRLTASVSGICPALDVTVYTVEDGYRQKRVEANDWLTLTGAELERRLWSGYFKYDQPEDRQEDELADNIRPVVATTGEMFGRAWISPSSLQGLIVVGGFLVREFEQLPGFWLAAEETLNVARSDADPAVPAPALQAWASEQAFLINRTDVPDRIKIKCAGVVLACGGDPGGLPVCLYQEKYRNSAQFKQCIEKMGEIWLASYLAGNLTDKNWIEDPRLFIAPSQPGFGEGLGRRWPYLLSDYDYAQMGSGWLHTLVREVWGTCEIEERVEKGVRTVSGEEITYKVDVLHRR